MAPCTEWEKLGQWLQKVDGGEMGGLALGDVAAGDRIRWASFGFQGIGSGSGADSALEWGRTRSWVCWKGSSFGVIGSRLPREVRGASWLG